jgi:hypothetical protein
MVFCYRKALGKMADSFPAMKNLKAMERGRMHKQKQVSGSIGFRVQLSLSLNLVEC